MVADTCGTHSSCAAAPATAKRHPRNHTIIMNYTRRRRRVDISSLCRRRPHIFVKCTLCTTMVCRCTQKYVHMHRNATLVHLDNGSQIYMYIYICIYVYIVYNICMCSNKSFTILRTHSISKRADVAPQ